MFLLDTILATNNLTIEEVTSTSASQVKLLSDLAKEIWEHHYIPIVGADQVAYMLDKFQSAEPIRNQLLEGYKYFIAYDNEPVGYLCLDIRTEHLFISKIYLKHDTRGQGFGRSLMLFAEEYAHQLKLPQLLLTVNKYNEKSITFYEKMGFKKTREVVFDIGNGYVMDDYEMVKDPE